MSHIFVHYEKYIFMKNVFFEITQLPLASMFPILQNLFNTHSKFSSPSAIFSTLLRIEWASKQTPVN